MKLAWLVAALAAILVGGVVSARAQPLTIRDAGQAKRRGVSNAQVDPDLPAEDPIDALVANYRTIWNGMSPEHRDLVLKRGGVAPEQYEAILRRSRASANRSAAPRSTDSGAPGRELPSISSIADLTAIRDGNLRRVQNDGCPAEVVERLAELNTRAVFYRAQLARPGASGVATGPQPSQPKPAPPGSAAAIAAEWFKTAPGETAAKSAGQAESARSAALESVLGPASRAASDATDLELRRKEIETELSRIDSEVARLAGACPSLR